MTQFQTAVFGSGCFWCTEAIFQQLKGVERVTSGYAGGSLVNPTYEQICGGQTGHAEVIKVEFDPSVVPYTTLLDIFFSSHDPTTQNRQGNDVGEQYRSVIFYTSEEQKNEAEKYIEGLTDQQVFPRPIVTIVEPLTNYYPAEAYHQNYFAQNPNQPYCQAIINPKVAKIRQKYLQLLKQ